MYNVNNLNLIMTSIDLIPSFDHKLTRTYSVHRGKNVATSPLEKTPEAPAAPAGRSRDDQESLWDLRFHKNMYFHLNLS